MWEIYNTDRLVSIGVERQQGVFDQPPAVLVGHVAYNAM